MSGCGGECPCLWEISTRVFRGEVSYCSQPPFGWLGRRKCLNISVWKDEAGAARWLMVGVYKG